MVEEQDLKQWRDAGHVARRTLEGIKGEIVEGKEWSDMHIFACDYGFLTGDVTHWHPDQEKVPDGPFLVH